MVKRVSSEAEPNVIELTLTTIILLDAHTPLSFTPAVMVKPFSS
ncbi:MAG TPA: hypothetical protein PKI98_06085 [Chitinophagaceae bacterium]|nr:hypothetical protein [Chitinophagaceae bacterium]